MIESVGALLAILGGIVALAAVVGLVIARIRTSADESTLAIWKGEAEAQKARGDRLETMVTHLTTRADSLTTRVEKVEHENAVLRELVTGRQEIAELARVVDARLGKIEALLTPSPVNVVNVNGGN